MLSTPNISILPYLPEVLDGLFQMLDDAQPGVRDVTEAVLGQFVERIQDTSEDNNVFTFFCLSIFFLYLLFDFIFFIINCITKI